MKTIHDLYAFAEELIEHAILSGDEDTAYVIEEGVDLAQNYNNVESQLAEILMAFISVEERINVPDYPIESVIMLRTTLRGMNRSGTVRHAH